MLDNENTNAKLSIGQFTSFKDHNGNGFRLHSDRLSDCIVHIWVFLIHHLPFGICFHSDIAWECQESTHFWPWWKVNSGVFVQPATHQAARQICPALQGKEWETDGSIESREIEVGQDVLKGDKQWKSKVEEIFSSRVRTVPLSNYHDFFHWFVKGDYLMYRNFHWGLWAFALFGRNYMSFQD